MTELSLRGPLRGPAGGTHLFIGSGNHPWLGLVVAVVGLLAIGFWLSRQV